MLRNLVIVLTGAVVLSLTSCSKDVQLPGGSLGSSPTKWSSLFPATWYNLRAIYTYSADTVYLAGVADSISLDKQWYYMKLTNSKAEASKFRVHLSDDENGWLWLQMRDGHWLSMTYNGYAYRSDFDNKVAWKIIDHKLYTNYNRWKDYPLEAEYFDLFTSDAYYAGVNFGDQYLLTGFQFVPAQ
ncbi:MAG: hypothetical protein ABIQ31_05585 [Ferruginibacter sp.]